MRLLRKPAAAGWLAILALFAQTALAQPLNLYKTYAVTGDYVVGGAGFRGLGIGTGCGVDGTIACATRNITIPDTTNYPGVDPAINPYGPKAAKFVPDGADIVGAHLYWMTVEKAQSAFDGQKGSFNGYAISGKVLGNPNAPTSWSAGGCGGSNVGATTLRTYRADVRSFLPVVNGKHQGNGTFPVSLADSGGGAGPSTLGATLVIIYRFLLPPGNTDPSLSSIDAKLKIISLYDGSFAPANGSESMTLTIQGFHQAASNPKSNLTHIVSNGQSNKYQQLLFNNTVIAGSASSAAFPGLLNGSWDNPTFDVSNLMGGLADPGAVPTSAIPAATNTGCVSWGAVIFGTTVQNSGAGPVSVSDGPLSDGLVDVWKTILPGQTTPGFFDVKDGSFVPLPGAAPGQRDLFIQIDYMCSIVTGGACDPSGDVHLPKQAALDMVGDAFLAQDIHVHYAIGNNYQTAWTPACGGGPRTLCDPYIIPFSATSGGGNIIDERAASVTCVDTPSQLCQFPGEATTSWKGGFAFLKNEPLNYPDENTCLAAASGPCIRRFQSNRRHSHHEVIFGHALGRAATNWRVGGVDPMLISIVDAGTTATITTASDHGLSPGARVTVSGATEDFDLNGTYLVQSASSTTFTITTSNVTDRAYNASRNPGLTVSTGPATSNMGWSDVGGADTFISFGKWRWDDLAGCQPNPAVPLAAGQVYCNDHVGTVQAQASALMHEVGHTLGLTHGGAYLTPTATTTPGILTTYGSNCKYNFVSSINYAFQFHGSGLPGYDGLGHVDYSGQVRLDRTEGNLTESEGIGPELTPYRTRWFGPIAGSFLDSVLNTAVGGRAATVHCNGTALASTEVGTMALLEGPLTSSFSVPLDLNNDGDTLDTGFAQDTNFNGMTDPSPLKGFNDWLNIDLRQIGARRGVLGFSADVWGGDTDSFGGDADSFGGSVSQDFTLANSTVDPPLQLTCTNCSGPSSALVANGKSVSLSSTLPGFGRIRTYYVWRANITNAPMSATNPPVVIKTVGGKTATTPPATTFTDTDVKNANTYKYFATVALGDDSGPTNSGNQSGASNILTITVNFSTKNTTTTTLALASGSTNPSAFGQSVTFTATVSPSTATGTVTFKDGSATIGTGTLSSGTATFTTSNLSGGTHSITATYGGDDSNGGSTSAALSQTVNKAVTTTALTFNQPVAGGASVSFTATVSPLSPAIPTGTVTFKDGSATIGSAPLNSSGVATLPTTLAAGTHSSITAVYGGDSNYNASTSDPVSVTVTASSDFSISASPGSRRIKAGTTAQYTVTITPSGGFSETVSFTMASAPAGPTAAFSPNTVPGSGSTTMTVTVPAKGTFTLTITGTSSPSGLAHSTVVSVIGN